MDCQKTTVQWHKQPIRFNNYIGVTLAASLYGHEGISMAAVCNAAIVSTVNLLCILILARFGSIRLTGLSVLKNIFTNPLVPVPGESPCRYWG